MEVGLGEKNSVFARGWAWRKKTQFLLPEKMGRISPK